MGMSAGQQDAAQAARLQSTFAKEFFDISAPGIQTTLQDALKDLGQPGSEPLSIQKAFESSRTATNEEFAASAIRDTSTIEQLAKQSGVTANRASSSDAAVQVLSDLETGRRGAMRSLKEQEVDATIQQRDFDLSTVFGIGTGAFASAQGYGQAQLAADQLQGPSRGQGALSGALGGATTGASVGGGWGALIGAVVGAAAGYFSGH